MLKRELKRGRSEEPCPVGASFLLKEAPYFPSLIQLAEAEAKLEAEEKAIKAEMEELEEKERVVKEKRKQAAERSAEAKAVKKAEEELAEKIRAVKLNAEIEKKHRLAQEEAEKKLQARMDSREMMRNTEDS